MEVSNVASSWFGHNHPQYEYTRARCMTHHFVFVVICLVLGRVCGIRCHMTVVGRVFITQHTLSETFCKTKQVLLASGANSSLPGFQNARYSNYLPLSTTDVINTTQSNTLVTSRPATTIDVVLYLTVIGSNQLHYCGDVWSYVGRQPPFLDTGMPRS